MSRYLPLLQLAQRKGYETRTALADAIGVSRCTIGRKLSGEIPWTALEIKALCRALEIRKQEIGEYFFPEMED